MDKKKEQKEEEEEEEEEFGVSASSEPEEPEKEAPQTQRQQRDHRAVGSFLSMTLISINPSNCVGLSCLFRTGRLIGGIAAVGRRPRLALFSHVSSPPARPFTFGHH